MSTYLSRKNATPISILYNPLILDNFPHNVKYKTIGRNWVIKHSTRRDFLKCKDDKEMEKSFFIMNTSKKGQWKLSDALHMPESMETPGHSAAERLRPTGSFCRLRGQTGVPSFQACFLT